MKRILDVVLLAVPLALGACARASAPPPAADTAAQPVQVAPPAASEQPASAPPSATANAAANTAPPAGNVWTTPKDCSSAADERARTTCEAKEELRGFVAARQSCSSAAECSIVPGSCPFGCYVPVAKTAEPEVRAKLGSLGERLDKAGQRCVYRCMAAPVPSCVEGRCATAAP